MSDEPRVRSHWTDDRLHAEFTGIRSDLEAKHAQNRADIADLRSNHGVLLGTVTSGFSKIDTKQERSLVLLTQIVGDDGQPEKGRLGKAEVAIENLKKFRWQLIAAGAVIVALLKLLKIL